MKTLITEITPIIAMVTIAIILITCIANDLDGGLVYTGITLVSGLGGYAVGRYQTEKIYQKKEKPPDNNDTPVT